MAAAGSPQPRETLSVSLSALTHRRAHPARPIGATGCTSAAFSPRAAPRPCCQQDPRWYFGVHTPLRLHLQHCPVTPQGPAAAAPHGVHYSTLCMGGRRVPSACGALPRAACGSSGSTPPSSPGAGCNGTPRQGLGSHGVPGCQPTGVPSTRWEHREPTLAEGPQGAGGWQGGGSPRRGRAPRERSVTRPGSGGQEGPRGMALGTSTPRGPAQSLSATKAPKEATPKPGRGCQHH